MNEDPHKFLSCSFKQTHNFKLDFFFHSNGSPVMYIIHVILVNVSFKKGFNSHSLEYVLNIYSIGSNSFYTSKSSTAKKSISLPPMCCFVFCSLHRVSVILSDLFPIVSTEAIPSCHLSTICSFLRLFSTAYLLAIETNKDEN